MRIAESTPTLSDERNKNRTDLEDSAKAEMAAERRLRTRPPTI
jgi:hypothetical protein